MTQPGADLPQEFKNRMARVFGDDGIAWVARLPSIIAEYAGRWSIEIGKPFELSYAYVAPATRADGESVIFKARVPNSEALDEIEALRAYAGDGCARLVEAADADGVMLLERLVPGALLADIEDDDEATRAAARIMRQLWRPPPARHRFPTVREWSIALAKHRERFDGGAGPLPERILARAEREFAALFAESDEALLLHGDLHHWNVLRAERQPWLAIDPHGVVGDRGYEAGSFVRNRLLDRGDPERLLARRLDVLSEGLRMERSWLARWGFAHCVLSACWSAEGWGSTYEDPSDKWADAIAVAEMLAGMM